MEVISNPWHVTKWYVCRYRVLSNEIRALETFREDGIEVYFPFVEQKVTVQGKQVRARKRPLLPGFIFVHTSLKTLTTHPMFSGFSKMKTHGEPSEYVTVHEADMKEFQWVAQGFQQLELAPFDDKNELTYDIVEIKHDDGHTRMAYLETAQGKKGGTFIIPLSQEIIAEAFQNKETAANFRLQKGALCYRESAVHQRFQIKRIAAEGNYHVKYIAALEKVSIAALELYAAGKTVPDKDMRRIRDYWFRYNGVTVPAVKFQARIYAVLYRCSIILGKESNVARTRKIIRYEILPAYKRYVDSVSKHHRATAVENFRKYVEDFTEIDRLDLRNF